MPGPPPIPAMLVFSPPTPYNLGVVSSTSPTSFNITFRCSNPADTLEVSEFAFSDAELTSSASLPFSVSGSSPVVVPFTFTPTGTGMKSITITITSSAGNQSYVVDLNSVNPATQGILLVTPQAPSPTAGIAPDTYNGAAVTYGIGVQNVGMTSFEITAESISLGTNFAITTPLTLPLTLAPGGPPVYLEVTFTPTPGEFGVYNDTLTFTTNLLAPQATVAVPLGAVAFPFQPVVIVTNTQRLIIIGFGTANVTKQLSQGVSSFNYPQPGVLVFNGVLWESIGKEKTLERLEIYFENVGTCQLQITVTVLRPSISPDFFQTVTQTITLGTNAGDNTDRSQYVDLTASGEILLLSVVRLTGSGPCSITGILPLWADRGEKVENV